MTNSGGTSVAPWTIPPPEPISTNSATPLSPTICWKTRQRPSSESLVFFTKLSPTSSWHRATSHTTTRLLNALIDDAPAGWANAPGYLKQHAAEHAAAANKLISSHREHRLHHQRRLPTTSTAPHQRSDRPRRTRRPALATTGAELPRCSHIVARSSWLSPRHTSGWISSPGSSTIMTRPLSTSAGRTASVTRTEKSPATPARLRRSRSARRRPRRHRLRQRR